MAPTSVARGPTTENIRVRKPVVEKLRRDRINGSIKQLRALLEQEFHQHHPSSKLEKADILEMTVSYLSQEHRSRADSAYSQNPLQEYHEGYSRCLQETRQFLAFHMHDEARRSKVLERFQRAETAVTQVPASPSTAAKNPTEGAAKAVWRPW